MADEDAQAARDDAHVEGETTGDGGNVTPADEDDTDPMDVDMEYVDSLPGGRVAMPIERKGKFVWLIVRGHVSPEARHEMVTDLNHIVRSGLWQQNWQPPQAH